MEGFVRLNKTLTDKGILIPKSDLNKYLESVVAKESNTDWYSSLFTFGDEAKDHFESTGSIKEYDGSAYTNNLVFDLDNEDLDKAREDVDNLLKILSTKVGLGKEGIRNHVRVYFSGNKGFHVFVKTSKQYNSEELKEYCSVIAGELDSFDPVIYNKTRCFRIANTVNQKSGLYKIPITLDLIKDKDGIAKIKALAINPNSVTDTTTPLEDTSSIEAFIDYHRKHVNKKKSIIITGDVTEVNGIRGLETIDFKKSKNIPKCIYALSQGIMIPGKGQRHEIFLHLGNFYRNQGHGPEVVEGILQGIAKLNSNLYPEKEAYSNDEIKHQVIKMVFSTSDKFNANGWGVRADNQVFANYCAVLSKDCRCPIHDEKDKKIVISINEIADEFATFAANFDDNIVKTGIKFIDENVNIATGTTNLIVGASGTGKTSCVLNMLENAAKEDYACVFFSLDMGKNLLYFKLAQRHTKYDQTTIFNAYKNKDMKIINNIKQAIKDHYKDTLFDFSGALSLEDMEHRVNLVEQKNSKKVKIVVVDYASRMKGPYSDSHANEGHNALLSKDVADRTEAAWIILAQIARASGDGATPLRSKRVVKASSAWEESVSTQLNVWRPFMGLHEVEDTDNQVTYYDNYMRMFIAKNRIGEEKEGILHWEGKGGHVRDLTEQEEELFHKEERQKEKLARLFRYEGKS